MSNESKLRCEIVQDLLPLYHDGVTNAVTREAVAAHLEACEACALEFRLLKSPLPVEEEPSTKTKFSAMMKNQKHKQLLRVLTAVLLSCALLAGIFYVLTEVPLVTIPASEYNIHSVYRYELDGNEHFFVMYSPPLYDGPGGGKHITQEENGEQTFIIKQRRTVLAGRIEDTLHDPVLEQVLITSYTTGKFNTLKFDDTVLWSESENGNDPVPEYVYVFAEVIKEEGGISYNLNFEKNTIRIHSESGRIREWDLQGNLLYDSAAEAP